MPKLFVYTNLYLYIRNIYKEILFMKKFKDILALMALMVSLLSTIFLVIFAIIKCGDTAAWMYVVALISWCVFLTTSGNPDNDTYLHNILK